MDDAEKNNSHKNIPHMDSAELHSVGAIIRHQNPFENLSVYRNSEPLSKEFIIKWAKPFYMSLLNPTIKDPEILHLFTKAYLEIDESIIVTLLGDFNWRTRIVGSYFAALKEHKKVEDTIGKLLLKSEVCYAGRGYCIALACFSTDASLDYLKKYLDYYLTRKDLVFEQAEALSALFYLNENEGSKYLSQWEEFSGERDLKIGSYREEFHTWMKTVHNIRNVKL